MGTNNNNSHTHKHVHASNYGVNGDFSYNSRSALGSSLGTQLPISAISHTNISPNQRRKKMDNLLKQVDEILMYQPPASQMQSNTSPISLFTTKRNTLNNKINIQEQSPQSHQNILNMNNLEDQYFENVDDDQMPIEHEPHEQIEPPLHFETRINHKEPMIMNSSRSNNNSNSKNIQEFSSNQPHQIKVQGHSTKLLRFKSDQDSNQSPEIKLAGGDSTYRKTMGDGDASNLWYDTLNLGSQTERQRDKNNLLFQKFVNFKETLTKKDQQIPKIQAGGSSKMLQRLQKQNQSQMPTNSTTLQTSKIQRIQVNSTSLSSGGHNLNNGQSNNIQINFKSAKTAHNGANLHYCLRKEGDIEEDKSNILIKTLPKQLDSDQMTFTQENPIIFNKNKLGQSANFERVCESLINVNILKVIISYITMTESINFQNLNKQKIRNLCNKEITKHQRNLIINTGLTRIERIRLWYNKTQLLQAKQVQKGQLPNQYRRLSKKLSKFNQEIIIDAERTFPHILLFGNKERAQDMLVRILNAVANHMPDLGYVQGMNAIALSLLLILQNEEDTFYIMIQLLQKYKLKDMYLNNFDQLRLLCFQLDSFVKAYLPILYDIFETQQIDSEYFATKWFLTLFTFDLSIENISTVLDLFMVEGFKSLIKIALAILDYAMKMFNEGFIQIQQYQDMNETFVDILKHFSEELKVDSHHLLCEAQNFKVTSKLMKDMEKLYIKENKPQRRKTERNPNTQRPVLSDQVQRCRSNSLKNRMLVIARDQNNKHEWRILPQLPSKLNPQEEVFRQQNIQNFEQFLEAYEVSYSQDDGSSKILSSNEKNELISIFSECEEIKGSDEKGINHMFSHKKPYASRMVMSNKKEKQVEDRVIAMPIIFNYNNEDEKYLRKQTQMLKMQKRKQNQTLQQQRDIDLNKLSKTSSMKNGLGLLSENVGAESRIDLGVPQLSQHFKSSKNQKKHENLGNKSKPQSDRKSYSNRKTITTDKLENPKLENIYETIQITQSPKQQSFKKFKERFTNKHQLKLQPTSSIEQSKKKTGSIGNVSLEKTVLKTKQNFTKPVSNFTLTQSNFSSSNIQSHTDSLNNLNLKSQIQIQSSKANLKNHGQNANYLSNNQQIYLSQLSYLTGKSSSSHNNPQNLQPKGDYSNKIVKQKSSKQINNHQTNTQLQQYQQQNQSIQFQQNLINNNKTYNNTSVSNSMQTSTIQQHILLAKQVKKTSNKSMSQIKEMQNSSNVNISSASALMIGVVREDTLITNHNPIKTSIIMNSSLDYEETNLQHQRSLHAKINHFAEVDINNDDHSPLTNVKIPRSKIKLSANHMHQTSQQTFQTIDSPRINKINPIKLKQKFDDDDQQIENMQSYQIRNLDTGEVTSLDPYMMANDFI